MIEIDDKNVIELFNIFHKEGFKLYIVGGYVRDSILGKKSKDIDFATDATPEKMLDIFNSHSYKIVDLGIKHGTIIVIMNKNSYEITTFRKEGKYLNYRKPENVEFTDNIYEDLKRRDFTMNAIAYSIRDGLIDPFNGMKDIKEKNIKTVGIADNRFREDALRMLRCIRFKVQLKFSISSEIKNSLNKNYLLIKYLSKERIKEEFNKILLSDKPSIGLELMKELKILEEIIPEIKSMYGFDQKNPNHYLDVFQHTLKVVDYTKRDLVLRMAALLHDCGKPETFFLGDDKIGHFYDHEKKSADMAEKILKNLKYPNKFIIKVVELIKEHMIVYSKDFSDKAVKKLMNRVKNVTMERLISFQLADIKATANPKKNNHVFLLEKRYKDIKKSKEPLNQNDLAVNGNDIIDLGFTEGKIIGEILNFLLEIILEFPEKNKKNILLNIVKKKWK